MQMEIIMNLNHFKLCVRDFQINHISRDQTVVIQLPAHLSRRSCRKLRHRKWIIVDDDFNLSVKETSIKIERLDTTAKYEKLWFIFKFISYHWICHMLLFRMPF